MNIDHIAHAVPNIDEAIMAYKKSFNVPISEVMIIEKQNIKMAIISFENLKIELMEPLNDKSPISKFLEKNPKGGLHHYCISVNDLKREYDEHKQRGVIMVEIYILFTLMNYQEPLLRLKKMKNNDSFKPKKINE